MMGHGYANLADKTRVNNELTRLMARNSELETNFQNLTTENSELKAKLQKLTHQIELYQNTIDGFGHVVILINGEELVFKDVYLNAGEEGGKQTALLIQSSVRKLLDHMSEALPAVYKFGKKVKIVCRVFADFQTLSKMLFTSGQLLGPNFLFEFARGFTGALQLFDFVDVGPGQWLADQKVIAAFKLHMNNLHCRQIILGCSAEPHYIQLLRKHCNNIEVNRVTLIETADMAQELAQMPFTTADIGDVFLAPNVGFERTVCTPEEHVNEKADNPLPSPPAVEPPSGKQQSERAEAGRISAMNSFPPLPSKQKLKLVTKLSLQVQPSRAQPVPTTWAKIAAPKPTTVDVPAHTLPPERKQSPTGMSADICELIKLAPEIPRNRAGMRLDPPCCAFDKEEVSKIRGMNLCNPHYLAGTCTFVGCCHTHDHAITPSELDTLRLVTRMCPCAQGGQCIDPKCIYGHRCIAPKLKGKNSSKKCIFKEECRFPEELHFTDTTVYKHDLK